MDAAELLKRVRRVEISTRKLSDRIFSGEYSSAFKGRGMAFAENREYQPGDEVRTIDGVKIIIPADSVELLTGATLDHTESQGLVIRNPNSPRPIVIDGLTTDDALSAEIEAIVSTEVNPALAAHGGFVSYVGHDGEGVAYMTMGGGCHGCSMSKMTMMEGVQTMIVEAVEPITAVRDLTDHATGSNPYYA